MAERSTARGRWMKPIMPGEREVEAAVLTFRPLTDVVDDPGRGAANRCRNDDGDVQQPPSDGAGDEITGQIVGKWAFHVLMDEFLQVEAEHMVSPNLSPRTASAWSAMTLRGEVR